VPITKRSPRASICRRRSSPGARLHVIDAVAERLAAPKRRRTELEEQHAGADLLARYLT